MCWSSTAHFKKFRERLAASSTPLFPPFHALTSFPPVCRGQGEAVMNLRADCWFHPPECWPEQCSRKWAGLQRNRVCSCLQSCRRGSMKKWIFTDLFTPPADAYEWARSKGMWKWKILGWVTQCVISTSCFFLCFCVCWVCCVCWVWLFDTPRDWSSPGSSVHCLSVQGKWTVTSLFKLDSVCGFMKTQNVILQVEFCPIWSSRSIPVPRTLYGTWRMLCGWMRADQRTARWSAVC